MKHVTLVAVILCALAFGCAQEETVTEETATAVGESAPASEVASQPAGTEPRGACSYIAEAEATEVLGQPSKYRSNDGGSNCILDPVTEHSGVSVDFKVTDDLSAYTFHAGNASAERVAGLGDEAVWVPMGESMGFMAVKKGTMAVVATASTMGATDPELKNKAAAFATKVLEKI